MSTLARAAESVSLISPAAGVAPQRPIRQAIHPDTPPRPPRYLIAYGESIDDFSTFNKSLVSLFLFILGE